MMNRVYSIQFTAFLSKIQRDDVWLAVWNRYWFLFVGAQSHCVREPYVWLRVLCECTIKYVYSSKSMFILLSNYMFILHLAVARATLSVILFFSYSLDSCTFVSAVWSVGGGVHHLSMWLRSLQTRGHQDHSQHINLSVKWID